MKKILIILIIFSSNFCLGQFTGTPIETGKNYILTTIDGFSQYIMYDSIIAKIPTGTDGSNWNLLSGYINNKNGGNINITDDGKLGIRTQPINSIHLLNDSDSPTNFIRMNTEDTNYEFASGLDLMESSGGFGESANYGMRIYYDGLANKGMIKICNGTTVFNPMYVLRNNGNVGFNEPNPTEQLSVDGNISITNSTSEPTIIMSKAGNSTTAGAIIFNETGNNNFDNGFKIKLDGSDNRFKIQTRATTTTTDAITILRETGLVGIQKTTPTNTLHIGGGVTVDDLSGTGDRMVISSSTGVLSTQDIAQTINLATSDLTQIDAARTYDVQDNILQFSTDNSSSNIRLSSSETIIEGPDMIDNIGVTIDLEDDRGFIRLENTDVGGSTPAIEFYSANIAGLTSPHISMVSDDLNASSTGIRVSLDEQIVIKTSQADTEVGDVLVVKNTTTDEVEYKTLRNNFGSITFTDTGWGLDNETFIDALIVDNSHDLPSSWSGEGGDVLTFMNKSNVQKQITGSIDDSSTTLIVLVGETVQFIWDSINTTWWLK